MNFKFTSLHLLTCDDEVDSESESTCYAQTLLYKPPGSVSLQVAFQHFQELDEHISYVATKVCHLGDQLEGVNTPRQRAVEAQRLMTYFNEFLDGELRSDVFNNPEKVSTVHCTHLAVLYHPSTARSASFVLL